MTEPGLLEKLDTAADHRGVTAFGGAVGAIMSYGAYAIIHAKLRPHGDAWELWQPSAVVAAACLAFSIRTVFRFVLDCTDDWGKALCAVVGLEGMMAVSGIAHLELIALACLVLVNALATACTLIAKDTRRGRKADAPQPAPAPPQVPAVVAAVARQLDVPRKVAEKVVDRQLAARPASPRQPRPAT